MHYVVQIMLDYGEYREFIFFELEEALELYYHIDRPYKALFSVTMAGERTRLALENRFAHKAFDYTGPFVDIKSLPCGRVKVSGPDAWAHLLNAVYQYRLTGGMWKLVAVHGIESEYEPCY